jgi:deleted-in-malignant-brain-tumors protein 1
MPDGIEVDEGEHIRLVDANGLFITSEGRLEVRVNGQWGSVCSQTATSANARVVCRQLGLQGGDILDNVSHGSGPISLKGLNCTGEEAKVELCQATNQGCDHSKDIGVKCT